MTSQKEKADAFKSVHEAGQTFIIPNPWDAGSAVMLQDLGFKALATTSSGFAGTLGRKDGEVSLEEKLAHCRLLASVTDIPITADFENGFADAPETVASNLLMLTQTGLVGGSIEDYSGTQIYSFDHAIERVAAAAEAVATTSFPFLLTARAESLLRGSTDLDDVIRRLQAFEEAGADVLYAPGLRSIEQLKEVMDAVVKPFNVLASFMRDVTLEDYEELGCARISIGGALAGHTAQAAESAASKMMQDGSFNWR